MRLKILVSSIIMSLMVGTSCATFNEITGRTPSTPSKVEKAEQSGKNKAGKQRGKRKKGGSTTAAMSKQNVSADNPAHPFTPADSTEIAKSLAGEWIFDTVAGIKVVGEENRPSLTFDENVPRFYASNGCNFFNGDFIIGGFNSLSFNNIITTANYCEDIPWGEYINALWKIATNFYITNRGSEEYLDLRDSNDRTLATLKRHQLSAINGLWDTIEIEGRKVEGDRPTIVIDLIEKTVHGNTGCNLFNGLIYQNPDSDRSVQFQNMAVTRMSCPGVATETAFLVALEQVERAIIVDDDTIILTDSNDRHLLRLKRTSL